LCRAIFTVYDSEHRVVGDTSLLQYYIEEVGKDEVQFEVDSPTREQKTWLGPILFSSKKPISIDTRIERNAFVEPL
jgi:hypothetical protein